MKENRFKSFIFSKTAFIISLVVLLVVARATWSVSQKAADTKDNLIGVEEELIDLADRERELQEDIAYLETEQGIEAEIRDKFSVAREGEQVILLVDKKNEKDLSTPTEPVEQTFFQKIRSWFKK